MFGGLFGGKNVPKEVVTAPSAGKVPDAAKLKEMKSNLAKIGNTQKRDYEAEAKVRVACCYGKKLSLLSKSRF